MDNEKICKIREICMNCKYDKECICVNVFSPHYNNMVNCNTSCEQWEDEDGKTEKMQ